MAVQRQAWLTAEFLESCLKSDSENFPEPIVITNFTAEAAVAAGNNYGSELLRVQVDYKIPTNSPTNQSTSLIIKSPKTEGYMEKFSQIIPNMYEREPRFYSDYIKETYKLMKHSIVPKHYRSPNPLIVVMEDLKKAGYVMVDRQKLLDFDHSQFYIKASAKLHALSIAVNKSNPDLIQFLVKESPEMEKNAEKMFKSMMLNSFQCLAAFLEDKPNCKECYDVVTSLMKSEKYWEVFLEMEKSNGPLSALVQRDPWCTNMMFKYNNSGKVVDIKLLDFQSLHFTSPVTEFVTFLWVSVNPEVREKRMKDLYMLYCDSLNSCLAELGCSERLPLDVFKQEVVRLSPSILISLSFMMPVCLADDAVDLNEYFSGQSNTENGFNHLYQGNTFKKYCPLSMEQAAREGVFDYIKQKYSL